MNNLPVVAVLALAAKSLTNDDLATTNICMQLYQRCDATRNSYSTLRNLGLVDEEGYSSTPSELIDALAYEVNRRVEAGTFN